MSHAAPTPRIVRAPTQPCPIKLREQWKLGSIPPDTIICDWFWQVRDYGLRRDEFYTAGCIAQWLRYEFDVCSDEYDYISNVIYEYASVVEEMAPDGGQTE